MSDIVNPRVKGDPAHYRRVLEIIKSGIVPVFDYKNDGTDSETFLALMEAAAENRETPPFEIPTHQPSRGTFGK